MMYWGCFACGGGEEIQEGEEAGQTALHSLAPTDSPTGSPRSSAKRANSARHESGRDWPVKPVIRPEQCQALGKNLPLDDFPVPIPL